MSDLNTLIPANSPLFLIEALGINDRGQIVGFGFLSNGDGRAFLLNPCDEHHPGVEGCDYSMVEASAAAAQTTPTVRNASSRTLPQSLMPRMSRYHFPGLAFGPVGEFNGDGRLDLVVTNSCGSDPASGTGQAKCGGSCSPGHPCPSGCRCFGRCFPIVYSGYCEINDSTGMLLTDGLCVSHRYNQCYIQPSANCPKGKPAINPSDTTCGGFGIARIDLARKCSF
jgi:hypothetical protein